MSYQFDDESALEELLNQQLDQKRTRPSTSGSISSNRLSNSRIGIQLTPSVPITSSQQSSKQESLEKQDLSGTKSKGKLASWLDSKSKTANSIAVEDENKIISTTSYSQDLPIKLPDLDQLLRNKLDENQLQEMTKQRLVQLIIEDIKPTLHNALRKQDEFSEEKVERLKNELKIEKSKLEALELRYLEQNKMADSRWINLNRILETRLESSERELSLTIEKYKLVQSQFEEEHKVQLGKIIENYQGKLGQEKVQFEEELRRRDEFHKLEMESKLKVDHGLAQLDTIFKEWQKMISTTIEELNRQFGSVEELLSKQTIEINLTNSDLAKKTQLFNDQYNRFDSQREQLTNLSQELSQLLSSISRIQLENESITRETSKQLAQFIELSTDLKVREQEMEKLKKELDDRKEKLNEEKFQLGLEANRLAYKEERADELMKTNERNEKHLNGQKEIQDEREAQLVALRSSLNAKSSELNEQNYELHLVRKRLTEKQDELIRNRSELTLERRRVHDELVRILDELNRVEIVSSRAQEELEQLQRLQKSLVCSICLDRLFTTDEPLKVKRLDNYAKMGNWQYDIANQGLIKRDSTSRKRDFEKDLARISRYIEKDAKQLEEENKYVELLSPKC